MRKAITILFSLLTLSAYSQAPSLEYKKIEADEYFQAGRYWDSFYIYRNLAKSPQYQGDYTIENQIKNSSKALFHWKKAKDLRAYQEYEKAKNHMKDLLAINPMDPNRGMLPILTLEMANQMKRRGIASPTAEGQANYYNNAIKYYNLALEEGLKDDMVFSFIRQVEYALENNPAAKKIKQPTTYDLNYQKDKVERQRTIEILQKENENK